MKTIVFGQKIVNHYKVEINQQKIKTERGEATVYTDKPRLVVTPEIKEWVEICSFSGEPKYNSGRSTMSRYLSCLNIAENETITVLEEIFRADLNQMHLRTDKIIEEINKNEEKAKSILTKHIEAFNIIMITSNEKLKSYCDIHNLSYKDTDAIDLFTIVFPNEQYEIINGTMKVKEKNSLYITSVNTNISNRTWSLQEAIGAINN